VIESMSRQPVNSVVDFERLAAQAKPYTLLRINRHGNGAFMGISAGGGGDDNQEWGCVVTSSYSLGKSRGDRGRLPVDLADRAG